MTIRDVAEAAGVSVSLVSFVLNAKRGPNGEYLCSASDETAKRIAAVADKLGYHRNLAASTLRSGRSDTIGVIVADISNTFFGDICRKVENISARNGILSLFGSTDDDPSKLEQLITKFISSGVDGLIIAPCSNSESIIARLTKNVPVVLIDRDLPQMNGVGRVMLDNEEAGRAATAHLIENGYKKIELVHYDTDIPTIICRANGYVKAMEDNGIAKYSKVNIIKYSMIKEEMLDYLRDAHKRGVEAIIFPSNIVTVNGIAAINKLGYAIPHDFAVVGFDQKGPADVYKPQLTYVYQPTDMVAKYSFEMLSSMLMGGNYPLHKIITPEFRPGLSSSSSSSIKSDSILLCGSAFDDKGGWIADPQFMETMGSSCLLAHGLGTPVRDASTSFYCGKEGDYHISVRTRNWVAYWSKSSAPGIFSISIDGQPIDRLFGEGKAEWHWQAGPSVHLTKGNHKISVHDLTGFDGRFDSILLSLSTGVPVEDIYTLRTRLLDIPAIPDDRGHYDFVVVGGGLSGICAAISAARLGLKVALVQDRKVLGGNNSSEVRVGLGGRINIGEYPSLGYFLNEFAPSRKGNARPADVYEDEKKMTAVLKEKNITLFLGYKVTSVEKQDSSNIESVIATNVDDYRTIRIAGRFFADCTGDATLGVLSGAEWRMGRESRSTYGEPSAPEIADGITLGASVQWYSEEDEQETSFPDIDWGIHIDEETVQKVRRGQWYWEVGMNDDQIADAEKIRDYGMLVAYSNWSYIKNHSSFKNEFSKSALRWMSYYAGKRESRRLIGDYVLTEVDLRKFRKYEDGCVSTSWYIDNHVPDPDNAQKYKDPWLSKGCLTPLDFYPIPFRCFYSKNIHNLFMAGRNISVSHIALGTTRVMRTCAMMGEVIGMASAVCQENGIEPRQIWPSNFDKLKILLNKGIGDPNKPYTQIYTLIDTTAERSEDC